MIQVEIITIGDELLIGQVVDTNSAWMAQRLNQAGLDVVYKTTVGDDEKDILDAFERALARASIVLVTGGIGPTKDDITKKTLCRFFNTRLVFDENTLRNVEEVVRKINREINALTREQAYVPEAATIIQNKMGTAPVTWFEKDGKVLVSMPGVPFEMKWIMEQEVLPRLKKTFATTDTILHRSFWVKNYSESMLAMHLEAFENELPEEIKLAYLPTSGLIRLRLTGKSSDQSYLLPEMDKRGNQLLSLLASDLLSEEDEYPEKILHDKLSMLNLSLSLAESCTGGRLASLFTAIPGSSQYFKGSAVVYSNEAKTNILGVHEESITTNGAVSQQVVEEMATGACRVFGSDCAIAVSGVAGPGGGTPEKPVGTVWVATRYQGRTQTALFQFSKERENNIMRACYNGIRMLLEMI